MSAQIEKTLAGKEIDVRIAKEVFGFIVHKAETWAGDKYTTNGPQPDGTHHIGMPVEDYSTDISAAIKVIEQLWGNYYCDLSNGKRNELGLWFCCFTSKTTVQQYIAYAETMPLAVCRSALMVIADE
jgi:hypothetical protein